MPEAAGGAPSRHDTTRRALDALVEVACHCGELVFVTRQGGDRRWQCHKCSRQFTVFMQHAMDGSTIAVPMFLGEDGAPPAQLPDPPAEMMLLCTCGSPLRITRRIYNHRVQCPQCAARMAIILTYDAGAKKYAIQARQLTATPLGDTHVLSRTPVM